MSTPASAIFSATRTRNGSVRVMPRPDSGLEEYALGRADARPVVDLVAELGERDLETAERGQDVERAEVAAVGDPQDLALEVILAAVGGDPELAQRAGDLVAVHVGGQLERGDDRRALVGVTE